MQDCEMRSAWIVASVAAAVMVLAGVFETAAALSAFHKEPQMTLRELSTTPTVDLERYQGRWYEIARLPQIYEPKDCVGVTADYSLRSDGKINVVNTCIRKTCSGRTEQVHGVARVVGPGRLKVAFYAGIIEGDYWIFELGDNYEYSIVGSPDHKSLWVLSRAKTLDMSFLQDILTRYKRLGFKTETMVFMTPCISQI